MFGTRVGDDVGHSFVFGGGRARWGSVYLSRPRVVAQSWAFVCTYCSLLLSLRSCCMLWLLSSKLAGVFFDTGSGASEKNDHVLVYIVVFAPPFLPISMLPAFHYRFWRCEKNDQQFQSLLHAASTLKMGGQGGGWGKRARKKKWSFFSLAPE